MGCWVVPTIAAELWGVPLSHVLECLRQGRLTSKIDEGFVLIDADPRGIAVRQPAQYTAAEHPATYEALSQEELDGLSEPSAGGEAALAVGTVASADELDCAELEQENASPLNWRQVRQRVSRLRKKAMVH